MTRDDAKQLIEQYAEVCREHLQSSNGFNGSYSDDPIVQSALMNDLNHIISMPSRISDDFSENKMMRWLGWIQGVLCAHRIFTLEDVKSHSMHRCVIGGRGL